jgi:FdhD protein
MENHSENGPLAGPQAGEGKTASAPASLTHMTTRERVRRFVGLQGETAYDDLAVEEPLQIRRAGEDVAVTMRTPGHDFELAAGFLYTEGIIRGKDHIESIGFCPDDTGIPAPNIVNVLPTDRGLLEPSHWGRNFYSTSSCGLCGKTSIDQIRTRVGHQAEHESAISLETLYSLEPRLRAAQTAFYRTGGLHAAGLFDLSGSLLALREDVGRHNAVDKLVGHALLNDMLPLDHHILLVSSRASFEIVQKALMAGVAIMAVISAPSSLAVDLAREAGMTLVAFLRQGRLNVYAGEERIVG